MLRRVLRGKSFLVKLVVVDVQGGKEGQRKETDLKKKKEKLGKMEWSNCGEEGREGRMEKAFLLCSLKARALSF